MSETTSDSGNIGLKLGEVNSEIKKISDTLENIRRSL